MGRLAGGLAKRPREVPDRKSTYLVVTGGEAGGVDILLSIGSFRSPNERGLN
jgi:hypothetical protein